MFVIPWLHPTFQCICICVCSSEGGGVWLWCPWHCLSAAWHSSMLEGNTGEKKKKKRFKLLWQRACKWLKCPWAKHCSGSRHSVLFLEQIQWPRWEPAPFQESAAARMWENGRNSVEHTDSFSFLIRKLNIKYAKTCVTEPRSRKVIVLSKREFQQKYENETLMLQWLG